MMMRMGDTRCDQFSYVVDLFKICLYPSFACGSWIAKSFHYKGGIVVLLCMSELEAKTMMFIGTN